MWRPVDAVTPLRDLLVRTIVRHESLPRGSCCRPLRNPGSSRQLTASSRHAYILLTRRSTIDYAAVGALLMVTSLPPHPHGSASKQSKQGELETKSMGISYFR